MNYTNTHLCHYGELKQSKNGFVYLDIDDDYIHKLITFIQENGFQEPPYFGKNLGGAHISVVYGAEVTEYGIGEIQECGQTIHFVPVECQIAHPPKWLEMDEVYFITVESPELDAIRMRYGLPTREYSFHITIGVKPIKY